MIKLVPSIAYLRIQKQFFVGYSMALAGWIGEYYLAYSSYPRPGFINRAMRKLGFRFVGEDREENLTQFFSSKHVGATVSFDPYNDAMFLQLYPLRRRIGAGITVRAQNIEFYDQFVVSIEPAQKLPHGIRSLGINPLLVEDEVPVSTPYWGMVHEDWENELKLLVMLDDVFSKFEVEEYRCPICFAPLRRDGIFLKCDRCGFVYAAESDFERVMSEFSFGEGEEFVF